MSLSLSIVTTGPDIGILDGDEVRALGDVGALNGEGVEALEGVDGGTRE